MTHGSEIQVRGATVGTGHEECGSLDRAIASARGIVLPGHSWQEPVAAPGAGRVAPLTLVDDIFSLFETAGRAACLREQVTLRDHALQAAALAEREGAPASLVAAALLHDIGHLLRTQPQDIADMGIDGRHEERGREWLSHAFGPGITTPVGLHVRARRYLCAVDDDYLASLSAASIRSLEVQGGPLGIREARAFERHPYFTQAVWLRRIDDRARVPGLPVPGFEAYRDCLTVVLDHDGG